MALTHLGGHIYFVTDNLPANYIHFFKKGFDYILDIVINSENSTAIFATIKLRWKDEISFSVTEKDQHDGIQELLTLGTETQP